MKTSISLGVIIAVFIASTCAMASPVTSYFNTDSEDWGTTGDVHGFQWTSIIGDPSGSIHGVDDVTGNTWYFVAPQKFLGNQLGAYGQTLSYELNTSDRDASPWADMPDVSITGNGITLGVYGHFVPTPNAWSPFSITLDENSGWMVNNALATQQQIKSVLSNITALSIRAEYKTGDDNAYLDNVVLNTVPEPASLVTLLVGICGVAMSAIKRKR